jgi:hypothetical protein
MQLSSHARSFIGTTVLAILSAIALVGLIGITLFAPWRAIAPQFFPEWAIYVLVGCITATLSALAAVVTLVAIGGIVVVVRDFCEERGIPYFPVRPRERIAGPTKLAIRTLLSPNASLRPGEMVEVRSLPEILATLDERGCLDGLPFMPEMAAFCGHLVPVHRRIEKVWDYVHGTGMRRVRDAVLLQGLRCNGQSHGGCQAACQLIWKEAWLKRPYAPQSGFVPNLVPQLNIDACTQVLAEGKLRFICQMTEVLQRASSPLPLWSVGHYLRDLWTGNVRLEPALVAIGVRLFNSMQWRLGGSIWPVLKPPDSETSPHQTLNLQPGQMVRVKSKHAIELTLNRHARNRGLDFGGELIYYCGGSYRVTAVINRIVHERTGELLVLKTPSVLLEGVGGIGGSILNPHNEYYFWREIWLDPEPSSSEVPVGGHRSSLPAGGIIETDPSIAQSHDANDTKP